MKHSNAPQKKNKPVWNVENPQIQKKKKQENTHTMNNWTQKTKLNTHQKTTHQIQAQKQGTLLSHREHKQIFGTKTNNAMMHWRRQS